MVGEEQVEAVQNDEELALVWNDCGEDEAHKEEESAAKVSLHAMNGSQGNGTIKLHGILQGHQVSILVDSGSSHDFLSQNLAKSLRLKTNPCIPFGITIADGNKVQCSTTVEPVSWSMAGEKFTTNMNLISLGGYDIILGAQWMTNVSPVIFNYTAGQITVNHQGRRICLQQNQNPAKVQLKLNHEQAKFHKEEAYFLIQITAIEDSQQRTEEILSNIAKVLQDYTFHSH